MTPPLQKKKRKKLTSSEVRIDIEILQISAKRRTTRIRLKEATVGWWGVWFDVQTIPVTFNVIFRDQAGKFEFSRV